MPAETPEIERSLYEAGRRAERLAARARLNMVVAAFVLVGGLMVVSSEELLAGPVMLASIAVWGVYALVIDLLLRRGYAPAFGYATVTLDLVALGLVSFATAAANGDFADLTKYPWTYAFFLIIAAAGLRQDARLALAAGPIAAVIYLSLFGITAALVPERVLSIRELGDWSGTTVSPLRVSLVVAVMLVTGAVTAAVAQRTRRLVHRTAHESVQAAAARAQRDSLREAFARYFPEPDAIRFIEEGGAPRLGGERRTVTLLFTDIRGFTTLSEGIQPEMLVARLNAYWEEMVAILFDHGGMLISFIGDGLLAAFGLPAAAADDADRALATARAMHRRIDELNASGELMPFGPLRVGMAIHMGDVIVGNIGSSKRIEFTVIGDVMNSVSRLEGMNKTLGTDLLISAAAVDHLSSRDGLSDVGDLAIRGRTEPLRAYTVIGAPGSIALEVAIPQATT